MTAAASSDKQDIFKEIIRTLVSVVEYKSEFFRGHSERVAANCILFGSYLALQRTLVTPLYLSGLLYDIGMVYIPMEIINKSGKLSDEEFKIVREHSTIAEGILSHLSYLKNVLPIIRHHHENFCGNGYPDGLKADKIPLGARILSILDSYDAMTSTRPHRNALTPEKALEQIRAGAGTIYDPKLADEFVQFIQSRQNAGKEKEGETAAENPQVQAPAQSSPALQKLQAESDPLQKAVTDVVMSFKRGFIEVPAFPMVISKIESALRSPDKGLEDVSRIIEQDQVVTLRLLSTARSAHYGGDSNIQTVAQALSRIGLKDSQNIVTVIAMKSMFEAGSPQIKEILEKLWIHAVATAHTARVIARQLRENEDNLFLLGLTHDVGKVLLLNGLAKNPLLKDNKSLDLGSVLEHIQAIHASFGGALLKRWGFKNEFISAVNSHETPDLSSGALKTNLILYLANMLTRRTGYSLYEDQPDVISQVISRLSLDESAMDPLLEEIRQTVQKTITS